MRYVRDLYIPNLFNFCRFPELNALTPLKCDYKPVHGVGQPYAERAFAVFKLQPFISVDTQKDPDLSTVKYSNPEEGKETLEYAIQTANENNADFIIATNPDRLALAERDPTNSSATG